MICAACSLLACASIVSTLSGCGPTLSTSDSIQEIQNIEQTGAAEKSVLEEKWGVEITGIRLSAADYMLDFRYRVVDPNKAAPLLSRRAKPYLIDEASGAKLIVPAPPKVGSLRQKSSQPRADKIYFVIFSNPGRLVKRGNKVTVVIGDFKAENLVVE